MTPDNAPILAVPITHTIPWKCKDCGASGTFTLVSLRQWTREGRTAMLGMVTAAQHPSHNNYEWTFPPSWHSEEFPPK